MLEKMAQGLPGQRLRRPRCCRKQFRKGVRIIPVVERQSDEVAAREFPAMIQTLGRGLSKAAAGRAAER